ncbi:hypothetical protein TWF730_001472 [Orbilia blumenaviensis]|uniref:Uncharacterized protein n=1 Tax=Orbilia blumenaviensis TaxID=1796055 RepID=A0AAV9UIN7_9PEZI
MDKESTPEESPAEELLRLLNERARDLLEHEASIAANNSTQAVPVGRSPKTEIRQVSEVSQNMSGRYSQNRHNHTMAQNPAATQHLRIPPQGQSRQPQPPVHVHQQGHSQQGAPLQKQPPQVPQSPTWSQQPLEAQNTSSDQQWSTPNPTPPPSVRQGWENQQLPGNNDSPASTWGGAPAEDSFMQGQPEDSLVGNTQAAQPVVPPALAQTLSSPDNAVDTLSIVRLFLEHMNPQSSVRNEQALGERVNELGTDRQPTATPAVESRETASQRDNIIASLQQSIQQMQQSINQIHQTVQKSVLQREGLEREIFQMKNEALRRDIQRRRSVPVERRPVLPINIKVYDPDTGATEESRIDAYASCYPYESSSESES